MYEAGEEIATKFIGAQEMTFRSRSKKNAEEILFLWILAGEQLGKDRGRSNDEQPSTGDNGRWFAQ